MEIKPNPGKNLIIEVDGKKFARYPIKTHLVTEKDNDYAKIILEYAKDFLKEGV
jgi:tRNA(His) 5'-end guanylyltransferase